MLNQMKRRNITQIRVNDAGGIYVDSATELLAEIFPGIEFEEAEQPDVICSAIKLKSKNIDELLCDIEKIRHIYKKCDVCFRRCHADRTVKQCGWCKNGIKANIYCAQVSFSEEPLISPCYEIFFSGCNIDCSYCHQKVKKDARQDSAFLCTNDIVSEISKLHEGIKTVSFLGGNPDQSILSSLIILYNLLKNKINLPIVWNSNFTFNSYIAEILNKYIDIFLPDFKFGNDECASEIAKTTNYVALIKDNIKKIESINPIIIRHLPLKNHWECCSKPIMDWISTLEDGGNYCLSLLPSFFDDNSCELHCCAQYAKRKKLPLIL